MNFLAPTSFFLGLLLPVIIALYLLKLRRVEKPVASNYLWRRMVRDVEANAPWQKLRPNLLMILQLLVLIALTLALARPYTRGEGSGGTAAIYILDISASMGASDVAPSRIESAKQRASQLIDDLPDTARATIIEAGTEARVLVSSSLDRRQAHLAVEKIHASTGGSDMAVALQLASAIAARQPGTEIVVFSDGKVDLPERLPVKGRLRYIPFGLSDNNQAVSLLNLETAPGGTSLTAFAQVTNYASKPAARRLSIFADGLPVNVFDLENIAPGGQKNAIAEGLPPETRVVEARLEGSDALALDDNAFAVQPDTRKVPVTLVTRGNLFLNTALNLLPGVTLTEETRQAPPGSSQEATPATGAAEPTQSPAPAQPTADGTASPSIWIYDNVLPGTLPTTGSLLFIAPPASTSLFTTAGLAEAPAPRAVDPADPLLTHVSLAEVNIREAVRIPLPDWAVPVVAGDLAGENIPLIFRGEMGGRRIAVLAFDLHNSDLPLQVAFPLLFSNLVDWLAPGSGSAVPVTASPGEPLVIDSPDGSQAAQITLPDGQARLLRAENNRFTFSETSQTGVYEVRFQGVDKRQAAFAVNLFSAQESNIKPASSLPGVQSTVGGQAGSSNPAVREWWRLLALMALGFLTGEWLVYQRAALRRLADLLRGSVRPPARVRR